MAKRVFDILITIPVLIVVVPMMVTIAIMIRIFMGESVLFKQMRPGFLGRPFLIYKFRTMKNAYDGKKQPLPDSERLTKLGKILRSTSLDELPELFNVLKGEMSLVGPRPLLTQYLNRYTSEQARRHDVKPGLTGWAQINGRNAVNWEEKFRLDGWYVDNQSLWLDLKIIALTILKILKREGINQPGQATASEFDPTRKY